MASISAGAMNLSIHPSVCSPIHIFAHITPFVKGVCSDNEPNL